MMILRNIKKKKKKEENFNTLFRVFVLCGLLCVCVLRIVVYQRIIIIIIIMKSGNWP